MEIDQLIQRFRQINIAAFRVGIEKTANKSPEIIAVLDAILTEAEKEKARLAKLAS